MCVVSDVSTSSIFVYNVPHPLSSARVHSHCDTRVARNLACVCRDPHQGSGQRVQGHVWTRQETHTKERAQNGRGIVGYTLRVGFAERPAPHRIASRSPLPPFRPSPTMAAPLSYEIYKRFMALSTVRARVCVWGPAVACAGAGARTFTPLLLFLTPSFPRVFPPQGPSIQAEYVWIGA